jgi:long-chain fatty acid transport protein
LRLYSQHLLGAIVLSMLIVCIALGGGYQLNEHGARAIGMGGAFVARASDPSAIFYNPAGLAFQEGINVMGGGTIILPSTKFKYSNTAVPEVEQEDQMYYPPNLYGTSALNDRWVVGIGVFTPYGLGSEWKNDWIGSAIAVKTEVQTFYINPTVSYKISDQLSVGAGVSYIYGSVDLSKRVPVQALSVNGTLKLSGTGSGYGFNAGILYKPCEKLSLGASFRSLTELEFSGDAKFSDMGTVLTPLFPGGTGKAKLPMPANLYVGAAYKISSNLTVEADFQFVGWSSYKELVIDLPTGPLAPAQLGGQPLQKSQTQVKNWDDGYMGRIGAEYQCCQNLTLRAGIIYDITGQPASKMEPMLPDADRIDPSIGFGYKLTDQLSVDVAYMIVLFSERTSTFVPDPVRAPNTQFGGTYNSTAHLFSLDIGYKF